MSVELTTRVEARLWTGTGDDEGDRAGEIAFVEIDSDTSPSQVALHTMDSDGHGSIITYQFDREAAIGLAHRLLAAVVID